MDMKKIREGVFWAGAVDWDRRLFDSLIPLPEGTSYNAYLVKGSEKTALLDTVDPAKKDILLSRLEGVDRIDYLVSQHAEQDHSGAIPEVIRKYPEVKVISSPKAKALLMEHLHIPGERIETVNDGERLLLGGKTLEVMHAPWVHWPETMLTYLREDKILFTCDLFGSHLAVSGLFEADEQKLCEASKRYYAEVMMPFRALISRYIERIGSYELELIAPSHGPLVSATSCIIESHREWTSDKTANTAVIPYATMHGSTELMVERLTEALSNSGVTVRRFNLAHADVGRLAMELVDASTLIIGSPTVLSGAHPLAASAAFLANALKPKLKFISIIGSYGWGGRMAEEITRLLSGIKAEMLEPVIIKGRPKVEDLDALERLAGKIAARHREIGVL